MSLLSNIGYILIGFIALVSIFLIVLVLLEKKLHLRFLKGRDWKNHLYIEKIAKIDVNKSKESMVIFDKLIKSFFREAFHIQGNPEYSELEKIFIKKNNKKATEICNQMTQYLYSKEDITPEKLQSMIILMAEIISSNKIISKEEKEEFDRKSMKNQPSKILDPIKNIIKKK
jgi:hypothetical protein